MKMKLTLSQNAGGSSPAARASRQRGGTSRGALFLAGLLAVCGASATPVNYQSWYFTGATNNRAITITLLSQGTLYNGAATFGVPLRAQPTNGLVSLNLVPANYSLTVDGQNTAWPFSVPSGTNTYNLWDLVNAGIYVLTPTNVVVDEETNVVLEGTFSGVFSNGVAFLGGPIGAQTNTNGLALTVVGTVAGTNDWLDILTGTGSRSSWVDASGYWHALEWWGAFFGDGAGLTNVNASTGTNFTTASSFIYNANLITFTGTNLPSAEAGPYYFYTNIVPLTVLTNWNNSIVGSWPPYPPTNAFTLYTNASGYVMVSDPNQYFQNDLYWTDTLLDFYSSSPQLPVGYAGTLGINVGWGNNQAGAGVTVTAYFGSGGASALSVNEATNNPFNSLAVTGNASVSGNVIAGGLQSAAWGTGGSNYVVIGNDTNGSTFYPANGGQYVSGDTVVVRRGLSASGVYEPRWLPCFGPLPETGFTAYEPYPSGSPSAMPQPVAGPEIWGNMPIAPFVCQGDNDPLGQQRPPYPLGWNPAWWNTNNVFGVCSNFQQIGLWQSLSNAGIPFAYVYDVFWQGTRNTNNGQLTLNTNIAMSSPATVAAMVRQFGMLPELGLITDCHVGQAEQDDGYFTFVDSPNTSGQPAAMTTPDRMRYDVTNGFAWGFDGFQMQDPGGTGAGGSGGMVAPNEQIIAEYNYAVRNVGGWARKQTFNNGVCPSGLSIVYVNDQNSTSFVDDPWVMERVNLFIYANNGIGDGSVTGPTLYWYFTHVLTNYLAYLGPGHVPCLFLHSPTTTNGAQAELSLCAAAMFSPGFGPYLASNLTANVLFTNSEMLAAYAQQSAQCWPPYICTNNGGTILGISRPLQQGAVCLGILNTNVSTVVGVTMALTNISPNVIPSALYNIRDVWNHANLAVLPGSASYTFAGIPAQCGMLYELQPTNGVNQMVSLQTNSSGPHGYTLQIWGGMITNVVQY